MAHSTILEVLFLDKTQPNIFPDDDGHPPLWFLRKQSFLPSILGDLLQTLDHILTRARCTIPVVATSSNISTSMHHLPKTSAVPHQSGQEQCAAYCPSEFQRLCVSQSLPMFHCGCAVCVLELVVPSAPRLPARPHQISMIQSVCCCNHPNNVFQCPAPSRVGTKPS